MEYPLDVLIYATGFQWMATSTFNMIVGRDGRTLSEKWQTEGTKTFLGLHSHGFPNLFIVTGPQGGGGSFNFTDAIDAHGDYVVWMLSTMRERGSDVVDVEAEAEEAYAEHCREADIAHRAAARLPLVLQRPRRRRARQPRLLRRQAWHRWRQQAQESLTPYVFQDVPARGVTPSSPERPPAIVAEARRISWPRCGG